MSADQIVQALTSIGTVVLGWLARELWSAVKQLRGDLDQLRVHIAERYIRDDRLAEVLKPMSAQLDRIEAALTRKADKP